MIRVTVTIFLTLIILAGCDNNRPAVNNEGVQTDSLSWYTENIKADSTDYQLWGGRAKLYLEKGDINASMRDLQKAIKLAPEQNTLFYILADVYFALGQAENGITSLKKALELNPNDVAGYLKLSEVYILLGDAKTAIRYAEEAISIDRQNAESFYVLAMAEMADHDTASAILNFGISANMDTANYMANMQLGAIYNSRGDSVCKKYFEKALDVVPGDEGAAYFLGMIYQEDRKFDKAIEYFDISIAANPDNRRAYYNKGYIYLVETDDPELAKQMFRKAVSINPNYVEAVYNLGRAMEVLMQYDSARIQYRKAADILPNYPLAVQGLNRLDDMGK